MPEIAWDIQTKVRDTVKELTGLSLHEINIHVQGVRKKKNEEEK
ncbi:MAG: Asp23/Gls24 family envelope stress response protein [Eubacteriales bacterium]|nr:Asp23/Gls24 family envelope stress response protein [Eubacteriales bacterium]